MVSIRLSVSALCICTTVDAFSTTLPIQQIVKVSSRFKLPPLGVSKTAIPDLSSSTKPIAETSIVDDDASANYSTWQKNLDVLLAPDTSVAERQIVFSDLLSSRDQIRKSVRTALREGKIDGLLTPTQKRVQDGIRAVERQITSDILPGIVAVAAGATKAPNGSKELKSPVDVLLEDLPTVVPKIGLRVVNAISNQAQKNLKVLQEDIMAGDPLRGITRIQEQTAELAAEARNVFAEVPEGLVGPSYRVLTRAAGYEIREYESYTVASTFMSKVGEEYAMDDLASSGEAFNALAAYLFGANDEQAVLEMTTPVTTTSAGEMRFYLKERDSGSSSFPQPVAENDEAFNAKGEVKIQEIQNATLAVAKFTGFVTDGEVSRQKDALMTCMAIDGVEIDVPHGSAVPHVILQYNPPYTLPIFRRNEIGIPVRLSVNAEVEDTLKLSWDVEGGGSADVE